MLARHRRAGYAIWAILSATATNKSPVSATAALPEISANVAPGFSSESLRLPNKTKTHRLLPRGYGSEPFPRGKRPPVCGLTFDYCRFLAEGLANSSADRTKDWGNNLTIRADGMPTLLSPLLALLHRG